MKSLRSKFQLLVLLVGVLFVSGCATTNRSQAQKLETMTHIAAYVGTAEALRSHPEWRPQFQKAANELAWLEQGEIDVVVFMEIVRRLPVKELKSDRAQLIITAATIVLADHVSAVPIDQMENIRPFIRAIREGIESGLTRESQ